MRYARKLREHIVLLGILLLTVFLDFWNLSANGYGNPYYAATVKSMTQSWHNFFFAAFDPGGFISVDKPPLGFWLQTLSAWIFGFKGWSILAPEALAGVAAVLLLYRLVAGLYGRRAGLIAALALAITPLTVATSRNNTIDSILVVAMLAAAWALLRALRGGRLPWLLLAAALLGVGFNVKFAEALLVLPAFILAYLLVRGPSLRAKLLHLACAAAVLVSVSLSWALVVDAVPAAVRPWVGSTQTNSEIGLAFGYDGLQRVVGRFGALAGRRPSSAAGARADFARIEPPSAGAAGTGAAQARASAAALRARGAFGGRASGGVLRLFTGSLGQQVGWLLPLALLAAALALWRGRRRRSPVLPATVMWTGWLLTTLVFFTAVPPLHAYYMVTMAPALGASIAIGAREFRRLRLAAGVRALILGALAAGMAAYELHLLWPYADLRTPFAWLIGGSAALALAALGLGNRGAAPRGRPAWPRALALVAIGLSLAAAPAYWSLTPLLRPGNPSDPTAGPVPTRGFGALADAAGGDSKLVQFLTSQYRGGYLLATVNADTAAPVILQTGLPVMAMGGFLGSDPAVTTAQLAALAASGQVKYFLVPDVTAAAGGGRFGGGFRGGFGDQQALLAWIAQHSRPVPTAEWQSQQGTQARTAGFAGFGPGGGRGEQLYEYTGAAG